jgi:hypothetical protein
VQVPGVVPVAPTQVEELVQMVGTPFNVPHCCPGFAYAKSTHEPFWQLKPTEPSHGQEAPTVVDHAWQVPLMQEPPTPQYGATFVPPQVAPTFTNGWQLVEDPPAFLTQVKPAEHGQALPAWEAAAQVPQAAPKGV